MADLADAFDARGNAPGPWWWFGKNLLVAADVLRQHTLDETRFIAAQPCERRTSIAVFGPMLMLRACAIECLLKAKYLDRGNILAKAGRYRRPPARNHDLIALGRLAGLPRSPEVAALLGKLQRYITAGRYPIETTSESTYPNDATGYAWCEGDEAEFGRLRLRLFEEDARLSQE
jgi:hypothetical protein